MSLLFMAGSILLGWNVAAQTVTGDIAQFQQVDSESCHEVPNTRALLDQIVYIEQDEEVVLDFDTASYLPERFDPHLGSMDEIIFSAIDEAQLVEMGFDVAEYLPKGFEPHVGDLLNLYYATVLDAVVLSFDTAPYLPKGFDAHLGNWNDIVYVESEDEIDLGFDTAQYLPKHFDPYAGDLDKILFLELDCMLTGECEDNHEFAEVVF